MATNKEHYTVLSMNFGNYEVIHPVLDKSDRARYIMVTDDPNLVDESGTWEIVCDKSLLNITDPFYRVIYVRNHCFQYTDDDIVIKIDGSVGINKSLDDIVDKFSDGKYDLSIMLHPTRNTMFDEYSAWVGMRGYDVNKANNILNFLANAEGYPVKDFKGLCQLCFCIQRRNVINVQINQMMWAWSCYLDGRVDQCIFSFILQKYFPNVNIMFVDQRIYQSEYFTWYQHNSNNAFAPMDVKDMIDRYWLNKKLHNVLRPQDF